MKIRLTVADMLRGQTIVPGWYKCAVTSVIKKAPKSGGDSLNIVPTFKLETKLGEEISKTFNTQAIGRIAPLDAAIHGMTLHEYIQKAQQNGGEAEPETDDWQGKKLQIKVINREFEGRFVNDIDNFLPYDSEAPF